MVRAKEPREVGLSLASRNPEPDAAATASGSSIAKAGEPGAIHWEHSPIPGGSPRPSRRPAFWLGALLLAAAALGWYLRQPASVTPTCAETVRTAPTPTPRVCGATASCRCDDSVTPVSDPASSVTEPAGRVARPRPSLPHRRSHRRANP